MLKWIHVHDEETRSIFHVERMIPVARSTSFPPKTSEGILGMGLCKWCIQMITVHDEVSLIDASIM